MLVSFFALDRARDNADVRRSLLQDGHVEAVTSLTASLMAFNTSSAVFVIEAIGITSA